MSCRLQDIEARLEAEQPRPRTGTGIEPRRTSKSCRRTTSPLIFLPCQHQQPCFPLLYLAQGALAPHSQFKRSAAMPLTSTRDAATSTNLAQSHEMGAHQTADKSIHGQTALPTKTVPDGAKIDKRSLDYVLKSGLAGGLAGCAVSRCRLFRLLHKTDFSTGQNYCRSPRSCQNTLSSLKPPICEIHRIMVWGHNSNAGYQQGRWDTRTVSRPLCDPSSNFPLRGHQIPRLRADPRRLHQGSFSGNPSPSTSQWLLRWYHLCLLHIPPGSDPGTPCFRDKAGLSLKPVSNMQTNISRAASEATTTLDWQ